MNEKKRKDRQAVDSVGYEVVEEYGKSGRQLPSVGAAYPDLRKYRRFVDHFDLTDAQKDDLLLTIWRIMQSFVDRAFGNDPVQQAREAHERGKRNVSVSPVIDLQPSDESGDGNKDMSGTFKRHAAGKEQG